MKFYFILLRLFDINLNIMIIDNTFRNTINKIYKDQIISNIYDKYILF